MTKQNNKKPVPNSGKASANRKPRGGFKDKEDRFSKEKTDDKRTCYNDPKWYVSDGQLAKDVASLSFNTALGSSFMLSADNVDSRWTIPGIMSILTMPTGGASVDDNSPINIAARKVYSFVRHANSGHSNYDPADLMMYLLAMDSIYIYWSWMVRLYGTLQVFSQTNRYVGDALIHAMGANAESLRQNLANFRAYINMFAVKASTFAVPKTMSLFIRHSWMYSNIYKDEDVSKSQFYVYAPAGVYAWNSSISAGGSGLAPVNVAAGEDSTHAIKNLLSSENTYANITGIGNRLINALLGNEDIGIMSGDILKAYGAENLWRLETIPEGYSVIPVYSEEVLSQIHNTEITSRNITDKAGEICGLQGFTMFQDTSVGGGTIIQDLYFNNAYHMLYDKVLDFWKQDPTPEDVLVATRNMYVAERNDSSSSTKAAFRNVHLTSYGSEVAVAAFILKYNVAGLLEPTQIWTYDADSYTTNAPDYMCFNEPPIRLVCNSGGTLGNIFGNIGTYAPLARSNIKQLHESALLAMYGVPALK